MTLAAVIGLFNNPYAGLVIFVALPAVFVLGLLLIPAGGWLQRRAMRRDPSAVPMARRGSPQTARTPHGPGRCGADRASTSSSCCWPAMARCTGWSRPASAVRCVTRRCTRSSSPGRMRRIPALPAQTAISAKEGGRLSTTSSRRADARARHDGELPAPDSGFDCRTSGRRSKRAEIGTRQRSGSASGRASSANMPTTRRIRKRQPTCRCTSAGRVSRRRRDAPFTGTPIRQCGWNMSRPTSSGRRFPSCA